MDSGPLLLNISYSRKNKPDESAWGDNFAQKTRPKTKDSIRRNQRHPRQLGLHKFSEFDSGLKELKTKRLSKSKPYSKPHAPKFRFNFNNEQGHDSSNETNDHNLRKNTRYKYKPRLTSASLIEYESDENPIETKRLKIDEKLLNLSGDHNAAGSQYSREGQRTERRTGYDAADSKYSSEGQRETNKVQPQIQGRYISSLFNHNPIVPHVVSQNVEAIKEEVFSDSHFHDLPLYPRLIRCLEERYEYRLMTRVQQEAIPRILEGKDVLLKSQTGSGKTLSFAVPIVQMLMDRQTMVHRSDGIYALVIVPTRELAIQCHNVFKQLVYACGWIVPGILMGGENLHSEKRIIRKGINILVCTLGRLSEHINFTANLSLEKVQYLVIDEADRLLDLGFERAISSIINLLHKSQQHQQTILLSATLTDQVERLAGMTLSDPCRIYVSNPTDVTLKDDDRPDLFALPQKLRQLYVIVPAKLRLVTLAAFILNKLKFSKVPNKLVVFLSTQHSVSFHHSLFSWIFSNIDQLVDSGIDSDTQQPAIKRNKIDFFQLYGDMLQKDRTQVFTEFHEAKSGVLLTTDVSARGLDLPHVTWIIQYTTPGEAKSYIHRVGRTARIGTTGHALLFLLPSEAEYINVLATHHINVQAVPMEAILKSCKSYTDDIPPEKFSKREKPRNVQEAAMYLQMKFENHVFVNRRVFELATKAYESFIRGYAAFPRHLKPIFNPRHFHYGHLAKSFGLCDEPTKILGHQDDRKRDHDSDMFNNKPSRPSKPPTVYSEFDNGLALTRSSSKKRKDDTESYLMPSFTPGVSRNRAGPTRTGPAKTGPTRTSLSGTRHIRPGPTRNGPIRTDLTKTDAIKTRSNSVKSSSGTSNAKHKKFYDSD